MTVSKVTNEWLNRLAGAYEIAGYDELRRNPSSALAVEHLDIVSALRELLALRASDDGAVTVEGWLAADCCLDGRLGFNHEGELMVFSNAPAGPDRDKEVQVVATIRKAKP